ncbi:50S ribosomal protein L25/general stress protein Ctc [Hymenobacter sp. DH14]|uniref:Large ribosomal subunit protein bL25 n=1 Tax=Hymenobacter cyanobacteriorum TaxID=2926463 RepID=A0A9X1VIP7_9BACT|nr:50S ribosomal protein L25/general stress protein Ctc [Hymenobacter cyanobacteriorum]MCI1189567.1 50S ribosomal protein L25/general stress protein Ctc [Hymenobacter cyanobacteriorum]
MKSLEIVGFKRANLGKTDAKALRLDAQVPCVLYGGQETVHFSVPAILFRELLYTPEAHIVDLNVEGTLYRAIVQDAQFHPVNEMLLHVDFLELQDGKEVKMEIPVKYVGVSPGVLAGGKLVSKLRKVKVRATAENLPDFVEVNISGMELGKSIKVGAVEPKGYTILTNPAAPIATITIPRALKGEMAANK